MKKILIVSDKFKGTLTAVEVCDIIKLAILSNSSEYSVKTIPVADGGEGSIDALVSSHDKVIKCKVSNALGKIIEAKYIIKNSDTAIIEMAESVGLLKIKGETYNPEITSSFGFGEMIIDAYKNHSIRKFILTIGGSATNDCGIGFLSALGVDFYDKKGEILSPLGMSLKNIYDIVETEIFKKYKNCSFIVASDVDNTLLGDSGSARVYSRQKGADDMMIDRLELGATNFVKVIDRIYNSDVSKIIGGGSAGGAGMALSHFLGAEIVSGASFILKTLDVEKYISEADIIISGEGSVDRQTLNGKLVKEIANLCLKYNKKNIVVCGVLKDDTIAEKLGIEAIYPIVRDGVSSESSMKDTSKQLKKLIEELIFKNVL